MADLTSLHVDRASLGVTDTLVPTSPLRLGALAAAGVGVPRLALDAAGNVTAGVLAVGDIPPGFTRRDVAETISADWTWASGAAIVFAPGVLAYPAATSRSSGTRLVLEPVAGSTEYAVGRATSELWTSTPVGASHSWFTGAARRLRLDPNGTLHVESGSGTVAFDAAGSGNGLLTSVGNFAIYSGGAITFNSELGAIQPATTYRENLGSISRKYLTLHAAELWVETLVAQATLATIGGRILVGPTTTLTRDVLPGDGVIYVKHNAWQLNAGGEFGSKLILESGGRFEGMQVMDTTPPAATAAGDYPYTVQRNYDGSGPTYWYAGEAVFDTGKYNAGVKGAFIDLYSVAGVKAGSSAGPTIVGNVRTGYGATDWREHWAIGNLQGVYGNTGRIMGAAFGDTSGMHLQIDATNGIRFLGGPGTTGVNYGQWDMGGNLTLGQATSGQLVFTAADGSLRTRYAGVDKMALLSDGLLYLNTGLVAGAFAGTTGSVRSVNATEWNAGAGFLFKYVATSGITTALIGKSFADATPKRCLQWDGASLKVTSDGLTIDENGITLQQQASGTYSSTKAIQWTPGGAYMWDSSINNEFQIYRGVGSITIQAGGSGIDRSTLTLQPTRIIISGVNTGGFAQLYPSTDNYWDLGTGGFRFRNSYAITSNATNFAGFQVKTSYAAFAGATPGSYYLELGANSAAKPVSSTWTVPADRTANHGIEPVDPDAALATVRRVPIIRYRTNADAAPGIGVVAQDVAALLPLSVRARADGLLDWDAHELFTLTVAAVQALAARLDALETRKDETR